jgi:CRISPR-associated endonuclease/helicase Cas3
MRLFGIDEADFGRFLKHLRVAIAFHDIGKANDGFQDAVYDREPQVIRHEYLSGLILAEIPAEVWKKAELDYTVILSAVLSHHVKFGANSLEKLVPDSARQIVRILSNHTDFERIWDLVQKVVGTKCQFPESIHKRLHIDQFDERAKKIKKALKDEDKNGLRDDQPRCRLLRAVRAALIVADAVGSAVVRLNQPIEGWVNQVSKTALTGEKIEEDILKKRVDQLRRQGRWDEVKGFSSFQRGIVEQGPRVLLTTPCGSGKTLAAWNWIKAQASDPENRASHVLFLYPTRATATEGFRDYISWAPEEDAALVSGTAEYDLDGMFENPEDERYKRKYRLEAELFALGLWDKVYISATADQFFPFLQYSYGPLCLLPVLAESIIVVDEVHSFDRSMYNSLKRFLKEFPTVPVLCMTATLSKERRRVLTNECGLKAYPDTPLEDLKEVAEAPRYVIQWLERDQVDAVVAQGIKSRERILWVVNRVADCQQSYNRQREFHPRVTMHCYHSRFRLIDRRERHRDVVTAFHAAANETVERQPVLGITTQVCEMSLDLDASLLITEVAPISSLIQRMGRCNRKAIPSKGEIGHIYVLRPEPDKDKPYEKADLKAAVEFINSVAGRDIKQADLEAAYAIHDPSIFEPDRHCPFLDSGPFADGKEETFRDIEEFTVPCILDRDLAEVLACLKTSRRKGIDGYVVPVPRRLADYDARPGDREFPRWLSVADANHYDPMSGFYDHSLNPPEGGMSS